MNKKFLWKKGDIVFERSETQITEEQRKVAKQVLDVIAKDFLKKLKEERRKVL